MTDATHRTIRLLDDATIDRIAAGEVIERPASVVKELVENALDAGARSLRLEIEDGGLALIGVEDDGEGIPAADLPLAFARHATSKIASAADIAGVGSFGFRGEALASIASVSRCRMISRTAAEEVGGLIEIEGGEIVRKEPAPRNRGTTVEVRDLFYNTPARRKYLGTGPTERRAVLQTVTAMALAHPEVRWRLVADGETALDLLPADSLPQRARDLLGPTVARHLERFELADGGLSVGGLASRPTWTRGNRTQQFLYVNRRPVRSVTLSQAIASAYREVLPQGRHPVVILFLQVPDGEVDVNVHPAKSEVRLLLERRIFGLVRRALLDGLGLAGTAPAGAGDAGAERGADPAAAALAGLARAEREFLERHFGPGAAGPGAGPGGGGQASLFGSGADVAEAPGVDKPPPEPTGAEADPVHAAPFWQLHRTYILTQIRGGLVVIDQHASHERILFDEARRALEGTAGAPAQQLLFPAHLELSPPQTHAFQQHREDLERLGFLIQPFGGQSVLVQGIPPSLKHWQEGRMLLDLLDDLTATGQGRQEAREALLASYACHGAIRAGELLTVPEMRNLVDRLFATELPRSCPHGRPTLIHFTMEDLEKRFGRR